MASPSVSPRLTAAQLESFSAFSERLFHRLSAGLRGLAGRDVRLQPSPCERLDAVGVRLGLAPSAAVLAMDLVGFPEAVLWVFETQQAQILAQWANPTEEADAASESGPTPKVLERLGSCGPLLVDAFSAAWGGRSPPSARLRALSLHENTWQSGSDPLGRGSWLRLRGVPESVGLSSAPVDVLLPWDLATRTLPASVPAPEPKTRPAPEPHHRAAPEPPAPPTNVDPTPSVTHVWWVGLAVLARQALGERAGVAVRVLPDVATLDHELRRADAPPDLVVITVPSGQEDQVSQLATPPDGAGPPVTLLLLEATTERSVLTCAEAGYTNIFPLMAGPDAIARRLGRWLAHH